MSRGELQLSHLRHALSCGTYTRGEVEIRNRIITYYEQSLNYYANSQHYVGFACFGC